MRVDIVKLSKKRKSKSRGITLVALVITIIILLTLAGVTVVMLLGQNGIINRAKEAKFKTEEASLQEQRQLAYLEAKAMEGQFIESKGVNSPILGEAMQPVDGKGNLITNYEEWFDYKDQGTVGNDEKTSKWANAKSKDGSMWVWIPRYAYKITNLCHPQNAPLENSGEIEIVFLQGTTDISAKGNEKVDRVPSYIGESMSHFVLHPSFASNVDKVTYTENGGWDKELPGFWVAKYEASHSNAKDANDPSFSEENANDMGNSGIIKFQPNVLAWRGISESEIFTLCKNMKESLNSIGENLYGFSGDNTPHQIKNSEWGACAYLAQSKYGRNKNEVKQQSQGYITGKDNIELETTTTGNEYGIYDLNGGSFEYVAAYLANTTNESTASLSEEQNLCLKNIYHEYSSSKFGDGIYETSSGIETTKMSWYNDYSQYIEMGHPLFGRGGAYNGVLGTPGLFYFGYAFGGGGPGVGFRAVVVM